MLNTGLKYIQLFNQNIRTHMIKPWVSKGRGSSLLPIKLSLLLQEDNCISNQTGYLCWPFHSGSFVEFYLMCHNGYPRIIQVKPGRNLSIGDDENVPYPGGVSLN